MWQQRLTTINNIQSHVISLEQEHKQHRKITHRLTRHGSKWVPMFHNDSWNSFILVIDEKETGSSCLSQRLLGTSLGPIADRHVSSNNPRNNCETHFVSSSLLVSKLQIAHVRYINILTWLWGCMVKIATFQDSIVSQFSLETWNKENQSKYRKMRIFTHRTWAIGDHVCLWKVSLTGDNPFKRG